MDGPADRRIRESLEEEMRLVRRVKVGMIVRAKALMAFLALLVTASVESACSQSAPDVRTAQEGQRQVAREKFLILGGGAYSKPAVWDVDAHKGAHEVVERLRIPESGASLSWPHPRCHASIIEVFWPEGSPRGPRFEFRLLNLQTYRMKTAYGSNTCLGAFAVTDQTMYFYTNEASPECPDGPSSVRIMEKKGVVRKPGLDFRMLADSGKLWLIQGVSSEGVGKSQYHLFDPVKEKVVRSFEAPVSISPQALSAYAWINSDGRYLAWLQEIPLWRNAREKRETKLVLVDFATDRRVSVPIEAYSTWTGVSGVEYVYYGVWDVQFSGGETFSCSVSGGCGGGVLGRSETQDRAKRITVSLPSLETTEKAVPRVSEASGFLGIPACLVSGRTTAEEVRWRRALSFVRRKGLSVDESRSTVAWAPSGEWFLLHERERKIGAGEGVWTTPRFLLGNERDNALIKLDVPEDVGGFPKMRGIAIPE